MRPADKKILIVGNGGREHALAWKCAQSADVIEVIVAPGNAGTASEAKVRNENIASDDIAALLAFAELEAIDLTIIGPEVPLVAGIADAFADRGLACFGPKAAAAQLEGSKAFTKDFLQRNQIPTAAYASFTDLQPAISYIRQQGAPIVIKADGLAAGKGVIVASNVDEAENAARDMLTEDSFGQAGRKIVIEEFLQGEEASFIVVTDGKTVLPLATSQDHKARDNGDVGPNTGGMGAYSPAPIVSPEIETRILDEVIQPTLRGLKNEGIEYLGFLYAGLMIMADGTPKVIEFNCRLGDPETQPIMARLQSDLVAICSDAVHGELTHSSAQWDSRAALGVVMAAGGYPANYEKGEAITGLRANSANSDSKVFHAGTSVHSSGVVTDGGRILCVVGLGESVSDASRVAYSEVEKIHWNGVYFRTDIGHRAIARESA